MGSDNDDITDRNRAPERAESNSSLSRPSRGWGQSESCRLSGWGQVPDGASDRSGGPHRSWYDSDMSNREPKRDPYQGPIDTWPNYRAITTTEWDALKRHQVVYTDGTNVPGEEPGWFLCTLCSKKCACKDTLQMHIEGAKHLRNMQWFETQTQGSLTIQPPTVAASHGMLLTEKDREVLKQNRCVVEEDWIVCTLCNKKFHDMYNLPEHIGTQKHRNNLDWANSVDGKFTPDNVNNLPDGFILRDNDYYCTLCDASMTSRSIMDVHVNGSRHLRNIGRQANAEEMVNVEVPRREGIEISRLVEVLGPASSSSSDMPRPRPPGPLDVMSSSSRPSPMPRAVSSYSMQSPRKSPPIVQTANRVPSPPRSFPPRASGGSHGWNKPSPTPTPSNGQNLPDLIQIDV